MICQNEKCKLEFVPVGRQKFCCKRCCAQVMQRRAVARRSVPCSDCGQSTSGTTGKCIKCWKKFQGHLTQQMTLAEHYNAAKFIRKNPSARNTMIRLYAKHYNPHLLNKPCQRCGYSLHTEIAHLKSICSFPLSATIAEVNDERNLLVLCCNCHWELDHGYLSISDIPAREY